MFEKQKGVTLIELMSVIAITGFAVAATSPGMDWVVLSDTPHS